MEPKPTGENPQDKLPEQQEPQKLPPVTHIGSIAMAGSREYVGWDTFDNMQIEGQRIVHWAAKLQSMAAPYAEAAQKIVPQDTFGKRRMPWHAKQGQYSYIHRDVQHNANTYTRFTVDYTIGKNLNRANMLRVEEFQNLEPAENRLPNQYICLHMTDTGDTHCIQFSTSRRNLAGQTDLIDNRIDFSVDGISYTTQHADSNSFFYKRVDRRYDPRTDKFIVSESTRDFSAKPAFKLKPSKRNPPLPNMGPQKVIDIAQKYLAYIPVEEEFPLY